MSGDLLPERTAVTAPYWDALERGELRYLRCEHCEHRWLPPTSECPACLRPEPGWESAAGKGRLVSWVVFHHAFHPAFAERLPYTVAVVELDEGPRLITSLTGPGADAPQLDQPLTLRIERRNGVALPLFEPA